VQVVLTFLQTAASCGRAVWTVLYGCGTCVKVDSSSSTTSCLKSSHSATAPPATGLPSGMFQFAGMI